MLKLCISILVFLTCGYGRYFTLKNRKFYDPQNGEIIFHGINVVEKAPPYQTKLTDQDIQNIKEMGLNSVRIDVSWAGIFTAPGLFNQTFLQTKVDIVNKLGKNGIYTLLEYHQDLFGQRFCGDGGPAWVTPHQYYHDFPRPVAEYPFVYGADGRITNFEYCQVIEWALFYKSYGVNRAFKGLYNNEHGILDSFKSYWRKVATAFKDNPYVIGYEIINEPWPGNFYKNPLVMIPGLSEVFNLQRFHDQVARQIREIDPEQNIGFEPVTWLNAFPAGYSHAPGGKQYADRSILCFHFYSPPTYGMEIYMSARKLDMKRLGVGGLITEFMAVPGTPGDPQDYFPKILDKCDKYHIGWFAYLYHPQLNKEMVTRVYAQRVGGTLIEHKYDPMTKKYIIYYEANIHAGQTIIFFPKSYYPHGFIMTTDPKVKFEIRNKRYIVIDSKNIGNRIVTVKIQKATEETKAEQVWQPPKKKKMIENQQKEQRMIKQQVSQQEEDIQNYSKTKKQKSKISKKQQKQQQGNQQL